MPRNFLPQYEPVRDGSKDKITCLVRKFSTPAKSEECVRQRVLHWLTVCKGINEQYIKVEYALKGNKGKSIRRADIVLYDSKGQAKLVVECKKEDGPRLDDGVNGQAIEYADILQCSNIWVTNGEKHVFLEKTENDVWQLAEKSKVLNVVTHPYPVLNLPNVPRKAKKKAIKEFYKHPRFAVVTKEGYHTFRTLANTKNDLISNFALSFYKLIFEVDINMPIEKGKMIVKQDFGLKYRSVRNPAGSHAYYSVYRDFRVSLGRTTHTLSLGLNHYSRDPEDLILCVGEIKSRRHFLQLNVLQCCDWSTDETYFDVMHHGQMNQIKKKDVILAARKSGLNVVTDDDSKEWISFGKLHLPSYATSRNSRNFLRNILHYGMIRIKLKEKLKKNRTANFKSA